MTQELTEVPSILPRRYPTNTAEPLFTLDPAEEKGFSLITILTERGLLDLLRPLIAGGPQGGEKVIHELNTKHGYPLDILRAGLQQFYAAKRKYPKYKTEGYGPAVMAVIANRISQFREDPHGRLLIQRMFSDLFLLGFNPMTAFLVTITSPKDIVPFIQKAARGQLVQIDGAGLEHRYGHLESFYTEIGPALMKLGYDFNSVAQRMPSRGTGLHMRIANESSYTNRYINLTYPRLDPNVQDSEGKTLPMTAVHFNNEAAFLLLAKLYPDKIRIDIEDQSGRRPLHLTLAFGMAEATRVLVKMGDDLQKPSSINPELTPAQMLSLDSEKIRALLLGVEIHPYRDSLALKNAIEGPSSKPVLVNGQAVLNIKANYTPEVISAARTQFDNAAVKEIIRVGKNLSGMPLISTIEQKRQDLRKELGL